MPIHLQGHLDALCGLYACINAVSLLLDGEVNCDELFAALIAPMRLKLHKIIIEGLAPQGQKAVLRTCTTYLRSHDITLNVKPVEACGLGKYWTLLQTHYRQYGPGSIVLSLRGTIDHWTCVRRVTDRTLVLADSLPIRHRQRCRMTIGEPTKRRIHRVTPEETYLLSLSYTNL